MAKRPDKHDATMEVSSSQLVPDAPRRPPASRRPVGPQNDMSMWAGAVVGGDQFTPAPPPPKAASRGRWAFAVLAVLVLAGGGYAAYRFLIVDDRPAKPVAQVMPGAVDAMPLISDAAVVVDAAPIDAAPIDAALIDAAVPAEPTIAPKPAAKKPVKKAVKKKRKKPVKKPVRRGR